MQRTTMASVARLSCAPVAVARAQWCRVGFWARTGASASPASAPLRSAVMHYQSDKVPRSLRSSGQVFTCRDLVGSDGTFHGVDPVPTPVTILDGRGAGLSLDANGVALQEHTPAGGHINYYNNDAVLRTYYPDCEALVKRFTGASSVLAFDHNVRSMSKKHVQASLEGGNAVQEPLVTYGVHNDYTVTSAPKRISQLAEKPKENDTLRATFGDKPPIDPLTLASKLRNRYMFMNVWRNISETPVQKFPLGFCDASSFSADDLIVFEIRYEDRVGENYFARFSPSHRWFFFPHMTRDEACLLKVWDSRGRDFVEEGQKPASQSTFSLHSAFQDPTSEPSAPDRESIEVRLVAFFDS
eukprot:TRINITY_DN55349_c0_g1_i1.p1 TRINITY_DN55349_c0_g1~~TRINITY_DN55349_c0_g1_i1.p1  ORF type:complete len:356 (-),score=39.69 TRINITY_DN55349_c0_g1_i1:145-1212(-)